MSYTKPTKVYPSLTITEMVKDQVVQFNYYRDGELWYTTFDGFLFPVPVADAGGATFKAEDKAIYFMRYIRKQVNAASKWVDAQLNA